MELLSASAVATPFGAQASRTPKLGLLVHVLEAYVQCPKALIRSQLWDPERHVERASLPSLGEILGEAQAVAGSEFDAAEYDRERGARYARGDGLY